MTSILPPDASVGFLTSLIVPLILGFLVGIVIKSILKVGLAIAFIIVILIATGILAPDQVIGSVVSIFSRGESLITQVKQIAGYLPYSSVAFIIGAVIGYFKG
jgi:hypothetical protein